MAQTQISFFDDNFNIVTTVMPKGYACHKIFVYKRNLNFGLEHIIITSSQTSFHFIINIRISGVDFNNLLVHDVRGVLIEVHLR